MTDDHLPTRTEGEGETLDMPEGLGSFNKGQILGERYQILEMLGRGGMGEVWKAFDLKLRVEVALKALRPEFFKSERRLDMLRQEVRAAREVMSPNVCRIFDLVEVEGRELVSMEYVDGATLLGVLHERGPLELKAAQDIASQFLAGLEAIHKVGLVHRDIKPENIMLTRAGRVVVMDFGLARQEAEGGGSVSGTPAYMSPEQAAGEDLDARADVYSAGVVLAEMVSPDGIKNIQSRQSVWEGVRSEPAKVPETPWAKVIQKAVTKDRENRFNTAHTLTRALEDVTLRVEGADDLHPYPGLASFTEDDAEYFFGREAEVEQMWRKLEGPARILGIMGPSGAGKSSFIGAGLTPNAPLNWTIIRCTPGSAAIPSLRGALTSELAGGSEALQSLVTDPDNPDVIVDAVVSWRTDHHCALLIVDQFEELFTLNSKDEQRRYAALLGRLPLEADVHVVVSMRDDFAAACDTHEALRPVFHELSVLHPPTGGNLRRALAQPATKCGYRFEDDDLVEEILGEVEGERGALPLLAFALAQLWEKRDREAGLLTREAYHDIGGVGGSLARHAEATIDRIGSDRISIVRELFRNLVTAEGTRAVREWNDLLSVFEESNRSPAEEVLRKLIDARLLTSYEVREDEKEPVRRIEIIHESLLANWPRLVRWQTQDADAAQLRDELRQAAKTWNEHGRTADYLWTGKAFREFALWRESYTGGLSDLEEAFASAMTMLATRQRRLRRIAVTSFCVALVVVASVVAVLWRRSVRETQRAEAAGLLSQAQVELESNPAAAVAYATASLDLADSEDARLLALEALWRGPTAFVVNEVPSWPIDFTPDGQWLVQATDAPPHQVHVIGADGSDVELEDIHDGLVFLGMDPSSGIFATRPGARADSWALWSAPERRLIAQVRYDKSRFSGIAYDLHRRRLLLMRVEKSRLSVDVLRFDGTLERLETFPFDLHAACRETFNGSWFALSDGANVYVIEFGEGDKLRRRRLERLGGPVSHLACDPRGRFVAARYENGEIRLSDLHGALPPTVLQGPPVATSVRFTPDGSLFEAIRKDLTGAAKTWIWSLNGGVPTLVRRMDLGKYTGVGSWILNPVELQIVSVANPDRKIRLWPLSVPPDAAPVILQRGDVGALRVLAINPEGNWLASSGTMGLTFWPLARHYPAVLDRYGERVFSLAFGPEGQWLATSTIDVPGTVRLWQLEGAELRPARAIHEARTHAYGIAASPDGKQILLATHRGEVKLLPVDGGPSRTLTDYDMMNATFGSAAVSRDGRLAAGGGSVDINDVETRVIQVWNLTTFEEVALIDLGFAAYNFWITFTGDNHLLSGNETGLLRWDLETGGSETLFKGEVGRFAISADDSRVLLVRASGQSTMGFLGPTLVLNLDTGSTTSLTSHGDSVTAVAMDAAGTIAVTGDEHGTIRVGPVTGDEPHLLLGKPDEINDLAVDPKGRWIASAAGAEVRLWPMPDLSKQPLHTLPREELIAKLKTLTNLRVVRDPQSATGWTLTHDPFPGWETVPTW